MLDSDLARLVDEDLTRFRVDRAAMTSQEIFEIETVRVFESVWIYLGHESEVANPGDFVRRTVVGRPLMMIRSRKSNAVRAFFNTCPHRGATICRQDAGNAKVFQCFYHAWSFDSDGALIGVPDEAGYPPSFDRADFGLMPVPRCESYRGFMFVSFNPNVEPLVDYLAGAKEYIDLIVDACDDRIEVIAGKNDHGIEANWKLLAENSFDGYHALPTHETYFKYLAKIDKTDEPGDDSASSSYLANGSVRDLGNGHAVIEKFSPYGRPLAKWAPSYGEESRAEIEQLRARLVKRFGTETAIRMMDNGRNLLIFPNLVINDVMSLTVRLFMPVRPDRMRVTAWAYAPASESPLLRAKRLDAYLTFLGPGGFAAPDDVEALESCQQGYAAGGIRWNELTRGMAREPRATDELQMRAFWRRWRDLMANRVLAGAAR